MNRGYLNGSAGLQELNDLKSLPTLELFVTHVTAEELTTLQKALPDTKLDVHS